MIKVITRNITWDISITFSSLGNPLNASKNTNTNFSCKVTPGGQMAMILQCD